MGGWIALLPSFKETLYVKVMSHEKKCEITYDIYESHTHTLPLQQYDTSCMSHR